MALRAADPNAETLTPALTKWDRRVLATLDVLEYDSDREPKFVWRDLYDIGRMLKTLDLADVKRTLDGLERFGYALAKGNGPRRRWVAWKQDLTKGQRAATVLATPASQYEWRCPVHGPVDWKDIRIGSHDQMAYHLGCNRDVERLNPLPTEGTHDGD